MRGLICGTIFMLAIGATIVGCFMCTYEVFNALWAPFYAKLICFGTTAAVISFVLLPNRSSR